MLDYWKYHIYIHVLLYMTYVQKPARAESRLPDLFGGDGSEVEHHVSHRLFDRAGSICSITLDLYGSPLKSVLL